MFRRYLLMIAMACCAAQGCGQRSWEITAENLDDTPCFVAVVIGDDNRSAHVSDLTKGRVHTLVAGTGSILIRSFEVEQEGKIARIGKPNVELKAGQRYEIVVGPGEKIAIIQRDL